MRTLKRKTVTTVGCRDMIGHKFGRLTVTAKVHTGTNQHRWEVVCDCGTEKQVWGAELRNGGTKSCGCLQATKGTGINFKHGGAAYGREAPEYTSWRCMMDRCGRETNKSFKHYGGRGIIVCERWRTGDGRITGFECFVADMGKRPHGTSIDRFPDNDGNYEPGNCRWATVSEQNQNRRHRSKFDVGAVA